MDRDDFMQRLDLLVNWRVIAELARASGRNEMSEQYLKKFQQDRAALLREWDRLTGEYGGD